MVDAIKQMDRIFAGNYIRDVYQGFSLIRIDLPQIESLEKSSDYFIFSLILRLFHFFVFPPIILFFR